MSGYNRNTAPDPSELQPEIEQSSGPPLPHRNVLQIVWQHRWIVLLTLALCVAGALTYLAKATPIYTSSSRLFVEQSGPDIIATNEGFMTQSKNYLYTQCELLKSNPILSGAIEALRTRRLRTFDNISDPVGFLKSQLGVSVGKKDDIITVSLDSPYPQEAADIVNAVVESYISYHSRQQRNTAAEILKILQREKVKRDAELRQRLEAVTRFKRTNETISFGTDNSNIIIQRLIKLSDALTQAELEMTDARARYEATKAMVKDPKRLRYLAAVRDGLDKDSPTYEEMTRLLLELTSLEQECTPDHPAVKAVELKLKRLAEHRDKRLKTLAEAHMALLEQRYVAARTRVAELRKSLEAQRALAQELNSKAAQYAMLESELKRTERMCDILDSRIKEIDVSEGAEALNISILEVARPSMRPPKPKKARIMAMSVLLGLLLGVGFALLRSWMDHRLGSAEEISQLLGLPVLGVVPHVTERKDRAAVGTVVNLEPSSQAAEAYRMIRTVLYFGVPDGETKTVLVTSPAPSDGKTTLASNLAIAMAQAGQKVLVLDTDLRGPSQHRSFQIENEAPGLCDVLTGNSSLDQAVRRTAVDGLDVLPCGTIPPNPSEMLNSQAFRRILDQLSQRYDRILLDAPPVMPVTDARILGAICDVALLVLRAEKSSRKPSQQAVEGLLRVGTQILGVVVNDAPVSRGRYGYYYYGYKYGYGKKRREHRDEQKRQDAASQADIAA